MEKTFTPLHLFKQPLKMYGILVCLLCLHLPHSFGQTVKLRKIAGPTTGSFIQLNQRTKYTEVKRENNVGHYSMKVRFKVAGATNNQYRGFKLNSTPSPISLSFDVQVYNDKTLVFSSNNVKVSPGAKGGYVYKASFKDANTSAKKIKVKNLKAKYNTNTRTTNSNNSQRLLIDNYYKAVTQLNGFLQKLPYLNYTDPDLLVNTQRSLHDIRQGFDKINNYHFITSLKLDQNDPAKLQQKIRRTNRLLNEGEQKFHAAEQKWHTLYYRKFVSTRQPRYLDLAIAKNKHFALPYIEKSSLALKNNRPEDALHQLDRMYNNQAVTNSSLINNATQNMYQKIFDYYVNLGKRQRHYQAQIKYYQKAQNICGRRGANIYNCDGKARALIVGARTQHYQSYLSKFNNYLQQANFRQAYTSLRAAESFQQSFGNQISDQHSVLYQRLYNRIVQKAQVQVRNQNYEQALNEVSFAEQIAQEKANVHTTNTYQEVKTSAHTNIYQQKFNRAQQAVASGDFNNAAQHLKTAHAYHQTNQQFIQNQAVKKQQLVEQYQVLLNKTVARGKGFNNQKQYSQALNDFQLGASLVNDTGAPLNTKNKVNLGLATAYTGLAINDNSNQAYQKSLDKLASAETALALVSGQQEQVNRLKIKVDQYKKEAIQRIITTRIDQAHAELKQDKLQEAMAISSGILSFTRHYNYPLTNDPTLNNKYEVLKKAIFNKECELNQKAYNQLVQKARENFDRKDFIKGWQLLEEAVGKANANKDCGIASQIAQQLKTRYKNAYQYALDWKEINQYAQSGQKTMHQKAIKLHYQVVSNYQQYNLKIFGIQKPDLQSFLENHSNVLFWTYGIIHFLDKNKDDDRDFATKLINKYIKMLPSRSNVKRLAYEMAMVDFKHDPNRLAKNQCKEAFEDYDLTSGRTYRKRVKWIKKYYCRQWNRLRKK
ncbi:hypothetical protein [Microscilla marina]|uniref:Tetratricopeptide repeat domain protein n=1 Tax=Microscilla marina ATCC 23134 TaxID=313606 RepID=A1ZUU6_MICM2|nr:hypothetical protein [Microscilla marina]EAY25850.1 hypothetical protein M23134_07662 [Microscilla marina ATCC 23134]